MRYDEQQFFQKFANSKTCTWANSYCAENERRAGDSKSWNPLSSRKIDDYAYTLTEWIRWCKSDKHPCKPFDKWLKAGKFGCKAKKQCFEDPSVLAMSHGTQRHCRPADFRVGPDGNWYLQEEMMEYFGHTLGAGVFSTAACDITTWHRQRESQKQTDARPW
mmetsp:Transcript_54408/g.121753  ORF Transcript_54408/g.121753 Transcript_54408/m.121753 type:complete len:162 (+) Transcript_54408:1733-2218(+)